MDVLTDKTDERVNLLPGKGTAHYYGTLFPKPEADHYLHSLMHTIPWQHDEVIMFGKKIITKRKVAWYGDLDFQYTYSNTTKKALPWTKELEELKARTGTKTGAAFNACLLNLYHDGNEGMNWHTDAEKELQKNGTIASLSFGAERIFSFKHKHTKETVSLVLEHGSLLVMKGTTQTYWLHRLPPSRKIVTPRINVTFRTIVL